MLIASVRVGRHGAVRAAISPLTMDCRPAASVARTTSMSGGLNRRGRCRIVDALVEVVIREQPEDAPGLMAEFLLSVHGHPLRLRRLLSRLARWHCLLALLANFSPRAPLSPAVVLRAVRQGEWAELCSDAELEQADRLGARTTCRCCDCTAGGGA